MAAIAGAAVGPALGLAAGGLAASILGSVVAGGINLLGSRLTAKKPKQQQFTQEAQGRVEANRSTIESHKLVYGQARVSGPFGAVTVDSGVDNNGNTRTGPNKFLHMVVLLAGHELQEIGDFYLNDQLVPLDGSGWATSAPYVQSSTSTVVVPGSAFAITSAVRTLNQTVTVTTAAPHGLSAGQAVQISGMAEIANDLNGYVNIGAVPSSTTFSFTKFGANNGAAPLGSNPLVTTASSTSQVTTSTSYVRVKKFLGTPTQTASPELLAEVPGWPSTHRLRGIPYLHVRLEYSPDVFPLGIPNPSAVVKGKKVFDPRSATTYWSDNATLCIRDYLTARDGSSVNEPYGFGCSTSEVNDTYATASANISDEAVTLSTGGTQARFTCNGVVDTATAPLDNLQSLVTSLAGAVTYVQGAFRVHAAAYDSPSADISTAVGSDISAGPIQVDWRVGRKELFNAVKGTFADPSKKWQPTDFPPVTNSTYETQDGGERIYKDIELPFTTHPEAAQRIAKTILEKGRQGIRVTLPVTHAGLRFAAWEVVTITDATLGWNAKPFRILRWNLGVPGPITLSLQEESSASYDWNSGEATTIDTAPDTNLPSPFDVAAPGALTVTEAQVATRLGDSVTVRAGLAWVASADPFLREYQVEYLLRPAITWQIAGKTTDTRFDIDGLTAGLYDFRVKTLNNLGVSSGYSTASKSIAGLLAPPTEPQNLTISTIGGLAVLRWDLSPDLDVRIGGKIVFRHSPTESDGWTQTTTIGNAVSGNTTVAILPLKPGVYLAKAVDSSGIESTVEASVTTAQATALAYANVTSLTEHATFTGTKTNCYVDGGVLRISGAGLFDAIPDLDAVADLDAYGGINTSGTYLFSGGMDLGSVRRVRLTSHLKAIIDNQLDRIDDRTALMDDWVSFDGDTSASADATVYTRTTNDNPAGTPTWGDWQRLDSGEFYARAFQFKCELVSDDPAYNILISELSVTADEVA